MSIYTHLENLQDKLAAAKSKATKNVKTIRDLENEITYIENCIEDGDGDFSHLGFA